MAHKIIILRSEDERAGGFPSSDSHSKALDEAVAQMTAVGSRVYRHVKSQMMRSIELPEDVRELGDAQVMVLHLLNGKGKHMTTELARMHKVTTPTMTRIIDGLVEKGYVERLPDREDRRCIYLELTGEGKEIGSYLDSRFREAMRQFLSPLTEEQLKDIKRAHQHLATLIGEGIIEPEVAIFKSQATESKVEEEIQLTGTSAN